MVNQERHSGLGVFFFACIRLLRLLTASSCVCVCVCVCVYVCVCVCCVGWPKPSGAG